MSNRNREQNNRNGGNASSSENDPKLTSDQISIALKIASIIYFGVYCVIPWLAHWDRYPLIVYLTMTSLAVVPVALVIYDSKNPWWVDIIVTIIAVAVPLEMVLSNWASLSQTTSIGNITTQGIEGYSLVVYAAVLAFAARKTGSQSDQSSTNVSIAS